MNLWGQYFLVLTFWWRNVLRRFLIEVRELAKHVLQLWLLGLIYSRGLLSGASEVLLVLLK